MRDLVTDGTLYLDEATLTKPLHWRRPRRIFVCSMTDLYGEWVPAAWIDRIWAVMAHCPQHTFQVLTKRPNRLRLWMGDARECVRATAKADPRFWAWPLPNVWLGVSIESDAFAWRAKVLAEIPAVIRFVSAEPLLGPLFKLSYRWVRCHDCDWAGPEHEIYDSRLAWTPHCPGCRSGQELRAEPTPRIHWVIAGGESGGPPARSLVEPCHCTLAAGRGTLVRGLCDRCQGTGMAPKGAAYAWVQSIQQQAQRQGASFFLKSWGGRTFKSGGRLLAGRTWDAYPDAVPV
jgi:protein gp37